MWLWLLLVYPWLQIPLVKLYSGGKIYICIFRSSAILRPAWGFHYLPLRVSLWSYSFSSRLLLSVIWCFPASWGGLRGFRLLVQPQSWALYPSVSGFGPFQWYCSSSSSRKLLIVWGLEDLISLPGPEIVFLTATGLLLSPWNA